MLGPVSLFLTQIHAVYKLHRLTHGDCFICCLQFSTQTCHSCSSKASQNMKILSLRTEIFLTLGHDFQDTWTMMFSMSNNQIMWRKFLNMTVWQSDLPEVWPGPSSLDSHFGREQSKKRQRNRKKLEEGSWRMMEDEDYGNRETVLWPTEYLNLHHALVSGVRALWLRSTNEKVSNCGAALWSE